MPYFSEKSIEKLDTCHSFLQAIFYSVIQKHDCTIIEGHRLEDRQVELFNTSQSKVKFGKHNIMPAEAVDVGPWLPGRGIPWPQVGTVNYMKDLAQFYYFAGYVIKTAESMNFDLRWGGDWDRDNDLADQSFNDLVHFELIL